MKKFKLIEEKNNEFIKKSIDQQIFMFKQKRAKKR